MKNARMDEYKEQHHAVYPGLRTMLDETNEEYGYKHFRGIVDHNLGVIEFNQYTHWPVERRMGASSHFKSLHLSIVHKGREHTRYWNAWYGPKTITRLANEFITELKGR